MKSEDFSVWLFVISGISAVKWTQALTAIKKAAADAASGMKTTGKRREDALERPASKRVERQGCPRCASREIVGWGRSDGLLRISLQSLPAHVQRSDQDADGASAQEGEVAGSRPGDDRGHESGEDRETLRRPSNDGVPLAASVSPRAI